MSKFGMDTIDDRSEQSFPFFFFFFGQTQKPNRVTDMSAHVHTKCCSDAREEVTRFSWHHA
jgi:hypothetical protein